MIAEKRKYRIKRFVKQNKRNPKSTCLISDQFFSLSLTYRYGICVTLDIRFFDWLLQFLFIETKHYIKPNRDNNLLENISRILIVISDLDYSPNCVNIVSKVLILITRLVVLRLENKLCTLIMAPLLPIEIILIKHDDIEILNWKKKSGDFCRIDFWSLWCYQKPSRAFTVLWNLTFSGIKERSFRVSNQFEFCSQESVHKRNPKWKTSHWLSLASQVNFLPLTIKKVKHNFQTHYI